MNRGRLPTPQKLSCAAARDEFSPYLDGAVSGLTMQAVAGHLDTCTACANEFAAWRDMQSALGALGPARLPEDLHTRLRSAIAVERERGTHLSPVARLARHWHATLAPIMLRTAAATAAAVVMIAGASMLVGSHSAVEANDEPLGAMTAPHYLYSDVPLQPIDFGHESPVLVEAKVNEEGRVYDYEIVSGPTTPSIARRVEGNLLASRFRPATIFGVPIRGRIVLTYSGVSVRG